MKERITQIAKGIVSYDPARFRIYPEQLTGELTENQSVKREVEIRTCNGKPVKGVACSDCPHVGIRGGSFKGYVNRISVEIDAIGLTAGEMLTGELVLITDGGEYSVPYAYQVARERQESKEEAALPEQDCGFTDETEGQGDEKVWTVKEERSVNPPCPEAEENIDLSVQEHKNILRASASKTAELMKLLLDCLTQNYSKASMEELELSLMVWQEEAEPFLTEPQNCLLQVFVMYHTDCGVEGARLYEQIKDRIYEDRENAPWAYLLGLYLEDRLLPEESRGSQVYQLQQYRQQHGDFLSLLLLSEVDLNRLFHPKAIIEELCAAYGNMGSPFLLWKLFLTLEEAPWMMDLHSRPMVQAFSFGIRYGMLPTHMLPAVLDLFNEGTEPVCARVLLRGLLRLSANGAYEGPELLEPAVRLMLQLRISGERYFLLYHQAACANMHSEELFEYYLRSVPNGCRKPIARPVVLYYTYGDSLSEPLRELLYTNVQLFYSDEERIYTGYRSRIEGFMINHLLQSQVNENLLYLYTTLLHPDMLDERAAAALADILSLEHVRGEKKWVKAVVRYPLLEQEWTFDLSEGEGDVSVWSRDAEVFCVDEAGTFLESEKVTRTLWMDDRSMEQRCRQLYPEHMRFWLADLKDLLAAEVHTKDQLNTLIHLANTLPVNWDTVCRIVSATIAYCKANPEDPDYDGVLAGASWDALDAAEQTLVFELLLRRGYVKEAENRIRTYGWKNLSGKSLSAFLQLRREKAGKSDDWQTAMCYELYRNGCRELWLLQELCLHYSGSQEKMLALLQDCLRVTQEAEAAERQTQQGSKAEASEEAVPGARETGALEETVPEDRETGAFEKAVPESRESGASEKSAPAACRREKSGQSCPAGCQAYRLGERLLVQSIFSGMWEKLPEIMGCYIDGGGQDSLLMSSYLVIRCQVYYMTGTADSILEGWFSYPSLQETFQGSLPEICCMALLKWYGERGQLTGKEAQLCMPLVEGLLQKNRCYSFFHRYTELLQTPAELEGKIIFEYHGVPHRQVMLVYQRDRLEKDERAVLLKEQYPGVYSTAVSLFAGEELRYRLMEDGEYQSVCFALDHPFPCKNPGYAGLNRAILAYEQGDWQKVQQAVREREINRSIIRRLFPMNCISEEG